MTERAEELLAKAKRLLDAADDSSWQATEALWRAHFEEGVSQREIARQIGRHPRTVARHIELWETHGLAAAPRQPFAEAYGQLPGSSPADRRRRETKKLIESQDEDDVAARLALWAGLDEHQATALFSELLDARAARWNAEGAERAAQADAERQLESGLGNRFEPSEEDLQEIDRHRQLSAVRASLRELGRAASNVARKWLAVREDASDEERASVHELATSVGDTIALHLTSMIGSDPDTWDLG